MPDNTSRRSFLSSGAALGAASMFTGTPSASAAVEPPPFDRRLRIGVIGVGAMSFMTWSWSDIIGATKPGTQRGSYGMPFLNMDLTHIWDVNRQAAERFANGIGGMKVVDKFDDMLGEIDGLIFADMGDVGYMHLLAKPYLEAGVPTYINRPFAYSLKDIDDLLESAAKGGDTPIMATAKYEHYREVPAIKTKLRNIGQIKMVQAAGNTTDFPMHFHIQFMMMQILGFDVKQVSLFSDGLRRANYVHETYLYPGGNGQPPYVCSIDGGNIPDSFYIRVIGTEGVIDSSMERGYDSWEYDLLHRYAPQVIDMQRTFYGRNYEPYDIVRKKTEIYLTGFYSLLERGGAPVDVGTVPVDWRVETPELPTAAVIPG